MFLLDESAPKAAKAIFESLNLQYIQRKNSDFKLYEYDVCTSHFNFDNSKIHNPNSKKKQ
ncbi:12412_t:CDS:2, partial [Entrophospora sp. SA101]